MHLMMPATPEDTFDTDTHPRVLMKLVYGLELQAVEPIPCIKASFLHIFRNLRGQVIWGLGVVSLPLALLVQIRQIHCAPGVSILLSWSDHP